MKRTKILTVLAALLLILGLAACGMSKDGKKMKAARKPGLPRCWQQIRKQRTRRPNCIKS